MLIDLKRKFLLNEKLSKQTYCQVNKVSTFNSVRLIFTCDNPNPQVLYIEKSTALKVLHICLFLNSLDLNVSPGKFFD